jgi:non-heme chloroperoxidase
LLDDIAAGKATMPYAVAKDDTRLFYKDWGNNNENAVDQHNAGGPRPAIVLIHGWPLQADSWDDVALRLNEAGYRTIAYDRRGFGRSDQPAAGYDYDTLADDLAAVIAAAGVEHVALAGFSMGGGDVARYLSRHGTRGVAAAILISSVLPFLMRGETNPDGVDADVFRTMAHDLRTDRAAFMQGFIKQFYGIGLLSHPVSQPVLDWTFAMAMQGGIVPALACMAAFANTDFRDDLPAFQLPTLFLHGTDDDTVPIDASSTRAAAAIPGAVFTRLSGAPHGMLASHTDAVAGEILGFLRSRVST